jgi:hypothetical protein
MITLGFDGSQFHDGTGLVATHLKTGYTWVLGVWECPLNAKDWQVPENEVDKAVRDAFEIYNVWRMYADPPYWQSWIAKWAGEYNKDTKPSEAKIVEWWTNRRKQMSYALEDFETAIKTGDISHDGNKALARHVANSYKRDLNLKDEQGKPLWLISKERSDSPNKIDLCMAAVLSWTARKDAIALGVDPEGRSIYETQGVKVF